MSQASVVMINMCELRNSAKYIYICKFSKSIEPPDLAIMIQETNVLHPTGPGAFSGTYGYSKSLARYPHPFPPSSKPLTIGKTHHPSKFSHHPYQTCSTSSSVSLNPRNLDGGTISKPPWKLKAPCTAVISGSTFVHSLWNCCI